MTDWYICEIPDVDLECNELSDWYIVGNDPSDTNLDAYSTADLIDGPVADKEWSEWDLLTNRTVKCKPNPNYGVTYTKIKMDNDAKISNMNMKNDNYTQTSEDPNIMDFKEIPGLYLLNDAITEEDETTLVRLIKKGKWSHVIGKRQVQQYGQIYDYTAKKLSGKTPIPRWLKKTAEYLDLPSPDNVIINKYEPGEGISPHIDNPCFGGIVASLSLCSPIPMNLQFNALKHTIILEPGSLLKLTGEARNKWTHGIEARKTDIVAGKKIPRSVRYSITFRTVKEN